MTVVFKLAACLWRLQGAYLLVYGWMQPPEFWFVTYGPPISMFIYSESLWFRHRTAIWLGMAFLGLLAGGGAVSGLLQWRPFQIVLTLQLALVVYSVVRRSAFSAGGDDAHLGPAR